MNQKSSLPQLSQFVSRVLTADTAVPTGTLIFAAGVSDSAETRSEAFDREAALLQAHRDFDGRIVYFGSCSVYDQDMSEVPYTRHKLQMERLVRTQFPNHTIFRLPQVVGKGGNKNNLVEFFWHGIAKRADFEVRALASRYLVDIEDVVRLVLCYLRCPSSLRAAINIAPAEPISALELARLLERLSGISGNYRVVQSGSRYQIPIPETDLSISAGVNFGEGYADRVLSKYYGRTSERA